MKTLGFALIISVLSLCSVNSQAAYQHDSLFLSKCRGFDSTAPADCLLIRVSGSDTGLVREVEGYFKAAGLPSQTQGLWTIYKDKNLELNNGILFLEIRVTYDEFESMEAAGVETAIEVFHQLRFKGDVAKFIMDAMIKAGVKTKTYPNGGSEVAGKLINCSNTPGIWDYSCELTIHAR